MLRILPIAIILVLSGIVVGLNLQTTPVGALSNSAALTPTLSTAAESALHKKLSHLLSKVTQLEINLDTEVASHKNTLAQLTELEHAFKLTKNGNNEQSNAAEDDLKESENKATFSSANKSKLTESQRNKQILTTIGIDDGSANRIQQLAEKKEMEQLYLRNTASREGWFGTEKYFEKTRELDLGSNIYREELGDEKYDQFLYAANRTNRITIQSVLSESPAENTGLQSGDFILSYDNQRVFNWSDLTSLTANGEAGENIEIEVQRNNQIFQYIIARGPLGIRLNSERVNPLQP